MSDAEGLDFAGAVRVCLRKYADFQGRATRSEFWWWVLFQQLAGSALNMVVVTLTGLVVPHALGAVVLGTTVLAPKYTDLCALTGVIFLLPWMAVTVRRLHDLGRSGWFSLLGWAPGLSLFCIIFGAAMSRHPSTSSPVIAVTTAALSLLLFAGWVWFIVMLCRRGTVGDNRFGADPLGGNAWPAANAYTTPRSEAASYRDTPGPSVYDELPEMSFGQAIASCFRNYAGFTGRARRSEYWWWVLFQTLISTGFQILILPHKFHVIEQYKGTAIPHGALHSPFDTVNWLYALAVFLPGLAVQVRRLHDINRSGWWLLRVFALPFLLCFAAGLTGALASKTISVLFLVTAVLGTLAALVVLLIWFCERGTQGSNRFGTDPVRAI